MVILDADRFGVSQLHQLRGRIGRGGHAGLCLLVSAADPGEPSAWSGSLAVAATRDGFELSRIDLEQRREGNVLGTEQSGGRGRGLKLLSVLRDEDVIERARTAATEHLLPTPTGRQPTCARARRRRLEDSERLADAITRAGSSCGPRATAWTALVHPQPGGPMTRIIGGTAGGRRLQDARRRGHAADLRPGARGAVLRPRVPARAR